MKYYLQDKRSWAGNIMLWWKRGGRGYTTNIDEAEIWTAEELDADGYNNPKHPKYKVWEKEYIDSLAIKVVDQQSTEWRRSGIKS